MSGTVVKFARTRKARRPNTIKSRRETQDHGAIRDPIMDEIADMIYMDSRSINGLAADCGPFGMSPGTIYNWINGKTRRPQNMTIDWLLEALGKERIIRDIELATPKKRKPRLKRVAVSRG